MAKSIPTNRKGKGRAKGAPKAPIALLAVEAAPQAVAARLPAQAGVVAAEAVARIRVGS